MLETQIKGLTAAILELNTTIQTLIAVLPAGAIPAPVEVAEPVGPEAKPVVAAEVPEEEPKPKGTSKRQAKIKAKKEAKVKEKTITEEDMRAKVLGYHKSITDGTGKEKLLAMLGTLGAGKLSEVSPKDYIKISDLIDQANSE